MNTKKILFAEGLTYSSPKQVYVGAHQYARRFAENGYHVGWLAIPVTPLHFVRRKTWDISWSRFKVGFNSPILHHNGKLAEIQPLGFLPYQNTFLFGSDIILRSFLRLTIPPIKHHLRLSGLDKVDILWVSAPSMAYIRNLVKYDRLVYRVADTYQESPFFSQACKDTDIDLMKRADVVIVPSKPLYNNLSRKFSNIFFIPNGFDETLFTGGPTEIPDEYKEDQQPKVVFVGAVREWFDTELLVNLAIAFNKVSFYIIGHCSIDIGCFNNLGNVYFLGPKKRVEIPSYLTHADVGLIPFKKSKFVDQIDPIKLYEYVSCGLPVISSPIQALDAIDLPVMIADGIDQFTLHLKTILAKRPVVKVDMSSFTWMFRFEQLLDIIEVL